MLLQSAYRVLNGRRFPLQAGSFLVGCVAYGLVLLESAVAAGGNNLSWVAVLLGPPGHHVHAGRPAHCMNGVHCS
jgi:acetoin utilization deacetylase AcuC-like enzyme